MPNITTLSTVELGFIPKQLVLIIVLLLTTRLSYFSVKIWLRENGETRARYRHAEIFALFKGKARNMRHFSFAL